MKGDARPVPSTAPRELLRTAEKSHWIQAWYQNSLQVVNRGKSAIAVWVRPLFQNFFAWNVIWSRSSSSISLSSIRNGDFAFLRDGLESVPPVIYIGRIDIPRETLCTTRSSSRNALIAFSNLTQVLEVNRRGGLVRRSSLF